jgi:predicted ribosome quality control (RQC) complex YloA/Tae2 family protein
MKIETIDIDDKKYEIIIGQNQLENDNIIKNANQNDIWFHLDNLSGPHIILKSNGDIISKRYLNYIGTLFTTYKNKLPNNYTVIYTDIKNVKLTSQPGRVNVSKTKKIYY